MSEEGTHRHLHFQRFNSVLLQMLTKTANSLTIFFFLLSGSAVYTPEDGDNWMLAKLNLQITDFGYSQIVEHLAKVLTSFCKIKATLPHFTSS